MNFRLSLKLSVFGLKGLSIFFLWGVLLLGSTVSVAQLPDDLDLDFWAVGRISELSAAPDGSVFAGGEFKLADRASQTSLIRIMPDGDIDSQFAPSIMGDVRAVRVGAGASVFIGGTFTQINGSGVARVAKLNAQGHRVADWTVSADNTVHGLHVGDDGIYVAGDFLTINGVPRPGVARVSASDGVLDPGFQPSINGIVLDVVVDHSGHVWLAGAFDSVNGQSTSNLVVLDGGGSVVRTFNVDRFARSIAVDDKNAVYVCGDFSLIDGQPRFSAARFSVEPVISLDEWQIAVNGDLFSCVADSDGLLIGGEMTLVNGMSLPGIARVDAAGLVDTDFSVQPSGVYAGVPGGSARVRTMARSVSGEIFVGGDFSQVGGAPLASLASVDGSTGALLRGYEVEVRAEIRSAVAQLEDGSLIIGGLFRRAGDAVVNYLARVDADGEIDRAWPVASDGPVLTSVLLRDGSLILGGFFSSIAGESNSSLVRLADPIRGEVDQLWRPALFGVVHSLHEDECVNNSLYVGGFFGLEPGSIGFEGPNFARFALEDNGAPTTLSVSFNQQVNAIVQPDCDKLLVGGLFDRANNLSRMGLARINVIDSGSVDASFNAGLNGRVWSLVRDEASGSVFLGGEFTQALGQSRARIAKLDPSLSSWNPGANGVPVAMDLDGLGNLYVVGNFTAFGGVPRARIAKSSISHPVVIDSDFNPGSDGPIVWGVNAARDRVIISGNFTRVGGLDRRAISSFSAVDAIFSDRFESLAASQDIQRRDNTDSCLQAPNETGGDIDRTRWFVAPECVD